MADDDTGAAPPKVDEAAIAADVKARSAKVQDLVGRYVVSLVLFDCREKNDWLLVLLFVLCIIEVVRCDKFNIQPRVVDILDLIIDRLLCFFLFSILLIVFIQWAD
jgi:surface polysaccharide O-acyltransferase-like enzyme